MVARWINLWPLRASQHSEVTFWEIAALVLTFPTVAGAVICDSTAMSGYHAMVDLDNPLAFINTRLIITMMFCCTEYTVYCTTPLSTVWYLPV